MTTQQQAAYPYGAYCVDVVTIASDGTRPEQTSSLSILDRRLPIE